MHLIFLFFSFLFTAQAVLATDETIELLDLDIISYESFIQNDPAALHQLEKALHEKGIVGIKGIPGYKEKVLKFIEAAREFSALPEEIKERYAPDHTSGDMFIGYEKGKEKFKRADGQWVVDDLKVSYYANIPDDLSNKWPHEVNLKEAFCAIGNLMAEMGESVMQKIGLFGEALSLEGVLKSGRMLYYRKSVEGSSENSLWCGAHFDHGIFTALLPAFYFSEGKATLEPLEAGLFVKTTKEGVFKKVDANNPDVMLFQVGEFGQLATDDHIRATEHRVHKAFGSVERYTLALFFVPTSDTTIYSHSVLTEDARYGGKAGDPCVYQHWHEESFKRYIVKDD